MITFSPTLRQRCANDGKESAALLLGKVCRIGYVDNVFDETLRRCSLIRREHSQTGRPSRGVETGGAQTIYDPNRIGGANGHEPER